jgi:hypothetical protein
MYRQMIGSLMYMVNTRPDICFAVNDLSQHMVEPRQVPSWYGWIWIEICLKWRCEVVGIYRF